MTKSKRLESNFLGRITRLECLLRNVPGRIRYYRRQPLIGGSNFRSSPVHGSGAFSHRIAQAVLMRPVCSTSNAIRTTSHSAI